MWSVVVIAFILENSFIGEYDKTMCEPSRDKHLSMVLFGQLYGDMLTVSAGSFTNIHSHVQNGSLDDAYQLALGISS